MLSRFDGKAPADYRITRSEEGKPVCESGPPISITHTIDYVACCVADSGDVGIDLEVIDLRRHSHKVARRFFSAREADWLDTQPPDRFFMLWVLKEAYGKAMGSGVIGALQGLQCVIEPPRIEVLESGAAAPGLCLFRLDDSYLAVAAIGSALGEVELKRWDADRGDFVVAERATEVARS